MWYSLRIRVILDCEFRLIDARERKDLILGERHLYRRLIRSGADLPRISPRHFRWGTWLSDETEEALFEQLQARGAFDIKVLQEVRTINCPVNDKDIWDILRLETFGVWRPRMVIHGAIVPSGWTLHNGRFLESVDTVAYRERLANSRGLAIRQ